MGTVKKGSGYRKPEGTKPRKLLGGRAQNLSDIEKKQAYQGIYDRVEKGNGAVDRLIGGKIPAPKPNRPKVSIRKRKK